MLFRIDPTGIQSGTDASGHIGCQGISDDQGSCGIKIGNIVGYCFEVPDIRFLIAYFLGDVTFYDQIRERQRG